MFILKISRIFIKFTYVCKFQNFNQNKNIKTLIFKINLKRDKVILYIDHYFLFSFNF